MLKYVQQLLAKVGSTFLVAKKHPATTAETIKDKASHAAQAFKGQAASAISGVGSQMSRASSSLLVGMGLVKLDPHYSKMMLRHAACNLIAWGVLAPLAIMVARYGRIIAPGRWRPIQVFLNSLMTAFGTVGVVIALTNARSPFGTFWHHYIGLTLATLAMINGLLGLSQLLQTPNALSTKVYKVMSPVLWILALGNAILGSKILGPIMLNMPPDKTTHVHCAKCIQHLPTYLGYYIVTMVALFATLEYLIIYRARHGVRVISKRTISHRKGKSVEHHQRRPSIKPLIRNKKTQ